MATARKNFTDAQKAAIFARDHAICAFSGKSLWVLDYGLSPTYDIDWVDHIKPASKGGGNEIENGICASSFYNQKKNNNSRDNSYLFFCGKPTIDFYKHFEILPTETAKHLKQFAQLTQSDWYFNRAASRFLYGLEYHARIRRGKIDKRDDAYYAKAVDTMLKQWHKKSKNDTSFEARKLIPEKLSEDQQILLKLRELTTMDDILAHIRTHEVWYENGTSALEAFAQVNSLSEMNDLIAKFSALKTPKRIMTTLETNRKRLYL